MRKIKVHRLGPVDENVFSVQQVYAFYSFAGAKYAKASIDIVFGLKLKEITKCGSNEEIMLLNLPLVYTLENASIQVSRANLLIHKNGIAKLYHSGTS